MQVSLFRLFALQGFLVLGLAMSFNANAQRRGQGPLPRGPQIPHGQAEILKAQINKYISYGESINVKKLVNQANPERLKGLELEKVILKASTSTYYGGASAQLLVNGMPIGMPQRLSSVMSRMKFDLPYGSNVIGQDVKSIQLRIHGSAHVKMVGLKVKGTSRPGPNRPGRVDHLQVNVNRSFWGSERVRLADLMVNMGPRINVHAPVRTLTLTARGAGSIMVTGAAQMLGSMIVSGGLLGDSTQTIRIGGVASLKDIKLRVSGRITLESVRVKLGR